jgi:hypothetical protein
MPLLPQARVLLSRLNFTSADHEAAHRHAALLPPR